MPHENVDVVNSWCLVAFSTESYCSLQADVKLMKKQRTEDNDRIQLALG